MSKFDRALVQSVICNIDADFQPMDDAEKARVTVMSSAYLAFEIREVFHARGLILAEKKGQFIDASDQMMKAGGFPSDAGTPSLAPFVSAEMCYNQAALYILLAVPTNPTELERKNECLCLISRLDCVAASRMALLHKFRLGQFVTASEKEAFCAGCPAKWRSLFEISLRFHHLHVCFKLYDTITFDALKQRMECSEDDCIKYLLDCNKTNEKNPIAMIPSTIDQVQGMVRFEHPKGIAAFNIISNQFMRSLESNSSL